MAKKTSKKTTTDAAGNDLYLLVQEERNSGYGERYFHLYVRVTGRRYDAQASEPWVPYGPDDEYSDGLLWSGLRLSCQGEDQSRARHLAGERDLPVYGFDCDYHDIHRVTRRRAQRMAKTLTLVETRLDKLTETRGYVRSYGEYVGRVAEVLGCAGIAFERTPRTHHQYARWEWLEIGRGVDRITQRIQAWVDEGKPAPAAAESGGWSAEDDAAREAQPAQEVL